MRKPTDCFVFTSAPCCPSSGWILSVIDGSRDRERPLAVWQAAFCFIPNRSLGFGQIARLCHAACFSPSRRRSGLRRGVARNRMRTEAGNLPESLVFPIRNGLGVSNDRFGFIGRPHAVRQLPARVSMRMAAGL